MGLSDQLKEFGEDLTLKAKNGLLDDSLCREDEINRVTEILSRRKKNNVILIGYPGVGKTSIVEGIANKIARKETNKTLSNKIIYNLDYHSLLSGTIYRGQLEDKVLKLIKELKNNKKIILFIDEIHTIFSNKTGSSSNTSLNNFLKPYLSNGDIQIIGVTTYDEYKQSIEKDKALMRRFQNIEIKETTKNQTLTILNNVYKKYEEYHNVKYSKNILKICIDLASNYISDRKMPDAALDILDESASIVSLRNKELVPESKKILKYKNKLYELEKEKIRRVKSEEFKNILDLKKELDSVKYQLEKENEKWYNKNSDKIPIVKKEDLYTTLSKITGIKSDHFNLSYLLKIEKLNKNLELNIIGQNSAVKEIIKVLRRKVIEFDDMNSPLASVLITGPSGVGKTTFAKLTSESIFGSVDKMIRVDMSEYKDETSISKFIGSSPGYIGYGDGKSVTEEVKRNPHSVILFDEAEKAHKEIFNLLLQILDEGYIKDSSGEIINFKHSIIIITSNLGTNNSKNIGFNQNSDRNSFDKEIKKFFKVEFLNRLDKIIEFKYLNKDDIKIIYQNEIIKTKTKLKKYNIIFNIEDNLKNEIIERYDLNYGARSLIRNIKDLVVDNILDYIVTNNLIYNTNQIEIILELKNGKVYIKNKSV